MGCFRQKTNRARSHNLEREATLRHPETARRDHRRGCLGGLPTVGTSRETTVSVPPRQRFQAFRTYDRSFRRELLRNTKQHEPPGQRPSNTWPIPPSLAIQPFVYTQLQDSNYRWRDRYNFATRDIAAGEEITFCYNTSKLSRRK